MNWKHLLTASVCVVSWNASSQTLDYYAELNQPASYGDARYNALAGSMTAMSGSFTALALNPAGAGLYRQDAFSMDLGIFSKRNTLDNEAVRGNTTTLNVNTLGLLGRDKESGWNFFFTYNSDDLYRERIRDIRTNTGSMTTQWLERSEGTPPDYLPELGAYEDLLYQSYATDYDPNSMSYYSSANLSDVDFNHTYFRKGMRNRWTFGGGTNLGKTLFYGASISLVHSFETVEINHEETYNSTTDLERLILTDYWNNNAIGLSGNLGVLYRPVQFLRFAAALELPHIYSFSQDWESEIKAFRPSISASGTTAQGYGEAYMWTMMTAPKLRSGATLVMGRSALLTVNHTLIPHDWSASISRNERYLTDVVRNELDAQHLWSAAGEWRLGMITLRSGVAMSPSFREAFGDFWRFGCGAGIRIDEMSINIGYSRITQQQQYYPFSGDYVDPLLFQSMESMLNLGAVWKF